MSNLLAPRIPAARTAFLFLLTFSIMLLAATGCEEDERVVSQNGTVVFESLEGGFHGIIGDDGRHWDPGDLSDEFAIDGLPVSFRGVPLDQPTYTWPRLDLLEIRRIGDPPPAELEPFRELARNASCADVRNRLFLIAPGLLGSSIDVRGRGLHIHALRAHGQPPRLYLE